VADTYPVADLTTPHAEALERRTMINPSEIARQLRDISDAIAPVLEDEQPKQGFGLEKIELTLTIGAEGGVAFVAKGSAEASITLTFNRGDG